MQAFRGLARRTGLPLSAPCRPCYALAVRPSRQALAVRAEAKPIEKLKRAPSAYNVFYQAKYPEIRATLMKETGSASIAACAQAVKKLWEPLTDAQKAPFVNKAAEIKAQFEQAKAEGRLVAPKKKTERVGPPRPLTPYAAFTKAEFAGFKAQHPTKTVAEIAVLIAAKWKTVPESTKNAAKAKFDKEMAEYKAKAAAEAIAAPAPATPKAARKAPAKAPAAVIKAPTPPAPAKPAPVAVPQKPRVTAPSPPKAATPVRGVSQRRSPIK